MRQAHDHRLARLIGLQVADQPPVELHERRSQLEDMAEAGESDSCVVDGEF